MNQFLSPAHRNQTTITTKVYMVTERLKTAVAWLEHQQTYFTKVVQPIVIKETQDYIGLVEERLLHSSQKEKELLASGMYTKTVKGFWGKDETIDEGSLANDLWIYTRALNEFPERYIYLRPSRRGHRTPILLSRISNHKTYSMYLDLDPDSEICWSDSDWKELISILEDAEEGDVTKNLFRYV